MLGCILEHTLTPDDTSTESIIIIELNHYSVAMTIKMFIVKLQCCFISYDWFETVMFYECLCGFYIWHCVPNILLWSILCKTVGLPSRTGESERTARRQFHSPTLGCFRGRLCEVAAGRGPLKQSRWPESNWTLPLRSVGVAPSLGRFWLVFTALKLRYVLRRHIILSDSDGNQGVLDCFTVYPGLGGSAKWFYVACCDGS